MYCIWFVRECVKNVAENLIKQRKIKVVQRCQNIGLDI